MTVVRSFLFLALLLVASACGDDSTSPGAKSLCDDVDCDDRNLCTADACEPDSGMCENLAIEDGTVCTSVGTDGTCQLGVCRALCSDVDCDDTNQCTIDTCNPDDGMCGNAALPDGSFCELDGAEGECRSSVCSEPSPSGQVVMSVRIQGGSGVAEVLYQATCGDAAPVSGALQVEDEQNPDVWYGTAALPVGDCMMLLTANDDSGEAICIGSVTFLVKSDETTEFSALLACGLAE